MQLQGNDVVQECASAVHSDVFELGRREDISAFVGDVLEITVDLCMPILFATVIELFEAGWWRVFGELEIIFRKKTLVNENGIAGIVRTIEASFREKNFYVVDAVSGKFYNTTVENKCATFG